VYASFSQDGGKTWKAHSFSPIALDWPDKLRIGIAAVNTTSKPLEVRFEDWKLTPLTGPTRRSRP
jgi:hypothetical protein